jgi:YidC/Oxa1 family membrane protein insertase
MRMENKTVIAFILSFLVLIIWSFVFAPKFEQKPPVEAESSPVEPVAEVTPKPDFPALDETPGPQRTPTTVAEKQIVVETPLYKITFSNVDATIKSVKLKEYRLTTDPQAPLVELVTHERGAGDFLKGRFSYRPAAEPDRLIYEVSAEAIRLTPDSAARDVTFDAMNADGISIRQTFRFYPDRYAIDMFVNVRNHSDNRVDGRFQALLTNLPPQEKKSYYAFNGVALLLDNELEEFAPKKLKDGMSLSGQIGWMAYEVDYFIAAIIPDTPEKATVDGRLLGSGAVESVYGAPAVTMAPQEQYEGRFTLYLGPRELSTLKQLDKGLDRAINFGWTDIIAKPLLHLLRFFNQYVKNYGVSIILLTILVKILFWPLTHKSYKSMKEMQKLQPLMAKLREKYKNDKQQMNKELMGLYKTYKVNPMGGCLPMVVQIPVFFALFRILGNSIELRHAPFLFWINDLSAPDRLFNFPFQIPFMSPPYGIPVLTLLMGASMFIQQKMTPTPGDPTQAKVMMFLPVIFTVMFINFPSGLVLYWLINNLLSIGQQYRIKRGAA